MGKLDGEPFGEYAALRPVRDSEKGGDQIGLACLDIDRGVTLRVKNFEARRVEK
jgi:hypothetical protein